MYGSIKWSFIQSKQLCLRQLVQDYRIFNKRLMIGSRVSCRCDSLLIARNCDARISKLYTSAQSAAAFNAVSLSLSLWSVLSDSKRIYIVSLSECSSLPVAHKPVNMFKLHNIRSNDEDDDNNNSCCYENSRPDTPVLQILPTIDPLLATGLTTGLQPDCHHRLRTAQRFVLFFR